MANITNAQNQRFTVPDAAAASYADRGFVEEGTSEEPAPSPKTTTKPKRTSTARTKSTKGATDGVPSRADGDSGATAVET